MQKPNAWHTSLYPVIVVAGMAVSTALAQDVSVQKKPRAAPATPTPDSAPIGKGSSSSHPIRVPTRAKNYYLSLWGIDNLLVRETASGNLIRFSYRVTDPVRANKLGDKQATPYLIGLRSHAMLQIPVMDNIGQLRQTGTSGAGNEYWMVFSNKGNPVRVGDRVNVVIGDFHADGLTVE